MDNKKEKRESDCREEKKNKFINLNKIMVKI